MGNLLYLLAVILIIGWLISTFAYKLSGIIHVLLIIGIIAIMLRLLQGKRIV